MKKLLLFSLMIGTLCAFAHKNIVVLIATYNNEKYAQWSLLSALNQKYPSENMRIIVINDCSKDATQKVLEETIANHPKKERVLLINNAVRKGALANHYYANHELIDDNEVVINLDGDDALAHENVLSFYDMVYSDTKRPIWMTYGQYKDLSSGAVGFCKPMPSYIVRSNLFRKHQDTASHPRTYYSWLYKRIKKEHLMRKGKFFDMCADIATSIPMMEMARNHFLFIPDILYIYNDINPLNDHKKSKKRQVKIDKYVRVLPRYEPLD